jgi:hypothetical protein
MYISHGWEHDAENPGRVSLSLTTSANARHVTRISHNIIHSCCHSELLT